jgi:hypothetical protein
MKRTKKTKPAQTFNSVQARVEYPLDHEDRPSYTYKFVIAHDFLSLLVSASFLDVHEHGQQWAKWIDRVDTSLITGYCFIGDFIIDGTNEIPTGKPRLILVCSKIPDETMKKGFLRMFRVVKMEADGKLFRPTHIATDDRKGGWALRIRDLTHNLLMDINGVKPTGESEASRFKNVEV